VKGSRKAIAKFMNDKIADTNPEALAVCKPILESEIIFTPGFDDCLANSQVVVMNAFVQRQMRVISITFLIENGSKLLVSDVDVVHLTEGFGLLAEICFWR
jgi:hypothetical protein